MRNNTIEKLNEINTAFYRNNFLSFDSTRQHIWPGWNELGSMIKNDKHRIKILDLGCGNGRFLKFAIKQWGNNIEYLGVDSNCELAEKARLAFKKKGVEFLVGDVFEVAKSIKVNTYDLVVAFGLFHHVPGKNGRKLLFEQMVNLTRVYGLIVCSFWQFAENERLMRKIVPWSIVTKKLGVDFEDLEVGDYILNWGTQKNSWRFCHQVDDGEINSLGAERIVNKIRCFYSDGYNRRLNKYCIWEKIQVSN